MEPDLVLAGGVPAYRHAPEAGARCNVLDATSISVIKAHGFSMCHFLPSSFLPSLASHCGEGRVRSVEVLDVGVERQQGVMKLC
jgi:hypothetical protein